MAAERAVHSYILPKFMALYGVGQRLAGGAVGGWAALALHPRDCAVCTAPGTPHPPTYPCPAHSHACHTHLSHTKAAPHNGPHTCAHHVRVACDRVLRLVPSAAPRRGTPRSFTAPARCRRTWSPLRPPHLRPLPASTCPGSRGPRLGAAPPPASAAPSPGAPRRGPSRRHTWVGRGMWISRVGLRGRGGCHLAQHREG